MEVDVTILVVDDDKLMLDLIFKALKKRKYKIDGVGSYNQALKMIQEKEYDVAIIDKNIKGNADKIEGGLEFLKFLKEYAPKTEALMMTGYATVDTAIKAMKLGACDFIEKPFALHDIVSKIDRIVKYKSFIDSETIIPLYKDLRDDLLVFFDKRSLSLQEQHETLEVLNDKIDAVFRSLKQRDRTIFSQMYLLREIASYSKQLRNCTPENSPGYPLIEKICQKAGSIQPESVTKN